MFMRDKMELQMLELFHKSGIGCITWSPISLQNDEGISYITRKPNTYQNKILNSKHLELAKICDRLGCDLTQLSLGNFDIIASLKLIEIFLRFLINTKQLGVCKTKVSTRF